jgi:hypothetical protein
VRVVFRLNEASGLVTVVLNLRRRPVQKVHFVFHFNEMSGLVTVVLNLHQPPA